MNITANEIHIWFARDEEITGDSLLSKYWQILSLEERTRQKRFYFDRHKHQYLITRALVRSVLSLYFENIPPQAWNFAYNQFNKPFIANRFLPFTLDFNLSHSEKMVVLAVTRNRDIGIDVEYTLRNGTGLEIAKKYFSQEEVRDLQAVPQHLQKKRFFDLWTLKEAYIKACGMGLGIPLDQFAFEFPAQGEVRIKFSPDRDDHPARWTFWQIEPGPAHAIALAVCNELPQGRYPLIMREITPMKSIQEVNYPVVGKSPSADCLLD